MELSDIISGQPLPSDADATYPYDSEVCRYCGVPVAPPGSDVDVCQGTQCQGKYAAKMPRECDAIGHSSNGRQRPLRRHPRWFREGE